METRAQRVTQDRRATRDRLATPEPMDWRAAWVRQVLRAHLDLTASQAQPALKVPPAIRVQWETKVR
jgi:hypothetical protein